MSFAVAASVAERPTIGGTMALDGRGQRVDREVGAEREDLVAAVGEHAPGHLEADGVALALEPGEQDAVLGPAARDADALAQQGDHADRDVGREVLVGDGQLAGRPEVADAAHGGRDDRVVDRRPR